VGKYLDLVRSLPRTGANSVGSNETLPSVAEAGTIEATQRGATKATKPAGTLSARCDISDISDQRDSGRALTLREVLAEINHQGSGPAKNAELYRRGELSEDKAVEYVAGAILHRRGEGFEGWRVHAPTVRAALTHGIGCGCEVCE
jgi:hypothetical protein